MIRDVKSKLPDNAATTRTMNYILEKAELVGGSEEKFDNTSMEEYAEFGAKKFGQVNNKYKSKTGRTQEVEAVHEIISFHTDDNVTPEMARDLALTVWRNVLDLDNRKHRWAVHTDTDETHVHLVWNKRDNKGNLYNRHNDYAFFEKACHEIEQQYGLKVVENRKFLKPDMPTNPKPSNEYRFEKKGEKSQKNLFKEAVAAATDRAVTASEFLELLDTNGYTLIVNGSQGYSLEKEGQTFKASEIGASYKLLKARFGDDPQFSNTLARLGVKKAPERQLGGISFNMYVTQDDIDQYETNKQKSNRLLDTRFDSRNGSEYFFKDTEKNAFRYDAFSCRIDFTSSSPTAIKAGLQKLAENVKKPTSFTLSGSEYVKREMWLQFHILGLNEKGHTVNGYSPSLADREKLAEKLSSFTNKKSDKNNNFGYKKSPIMKSLNVVKKLGKPALNVAVQGFVNALDANNSISSGVLEEKLSEMRALDNQMKQSNEKQSSDAVTPLKRKLKPRPD